MKDYYAALDIAPSATDAQIKTAYRKKAAKLHPDRNPDKFAALSFQTMQEAYDILSDAVKRASYDDARRRGLIDSPIEVARQIWKIFLERTVV
jgi:curved DNA-binding protein CbpA